MCVCVCGYVLLWTRKYENVRVERTVSSRHHFFSSSLFPFLQTWPESTALTTHTNTRCSNIRRTRWDRVASGCSFGRLAKRDVVQLHRRFDAIQFSKSAQKQEVKIQREILSQSTFVQRTRRTDVDQECVSAGIWWHDTYHDTVGTIRYITILEARWYNEVFGKIYLLSIKTLYHHLISSSPSHSNIIFVSHFTH